MKQKKDVNKKMASIGFFFVLDFHKLQDKRFDLRSLESYWLMLEILI